MAQKHRNSEGPNQGLQLMADALNQMNCRNDSQSETLEKTLEQEKLNQEIADCENVILHLEADLKANKNEIDRTYEWASEYETGNEEKSSEEILKELYEENAKLSNELYSVEQEQLELMDQYHSLSM